METDRPPPMSPEEIRRALREDNVPPEVQEDLFEFLCDFYSDGPRISGQELLAILGENQRRYNREEIGSSRKAKG